MTDPVAYLREVLRGFDEESMEIQADARRQTEHVARLRAERLALLTQRRRAVLGLFAAVAAGGPAESKSA